LSLEALERRGIKLKGIVFNGHENRDTESIILSRSGARFLGRISETAEINQDFIEKESLKFLDI
jgi:dethiobiotin synthetase